MAKLTTSEVYDISQIADTNTYKEVSTFIDYQIDFTRDVVESYYNGLTLNENLKKYSYNLSIAHGVPVTLTLKSPFTLSAIESLYAIRSYTVSRSTTNSIILTVWFDETLSVVADQATWIAGTIVRYRTNSVAGLKVGDVVTFSGFGTANNNNTCQITEIDTTNNYLYVNNRKRTSSTGDETRTSYAGTYQDKLTITTLFIE